MADVFISYASADRAAAQRIGEALEKAGLTTWWDRHIKGGAEFSRDIEQQLDSARHVLVLWSKDAVNSRWVRDEASVAADSGRLVGVTIDGTPPPLGFRQFQTIDLSRWKAKGSALPQDLADALGADGRAQPQPAQPARRGPARKWVAIAAALVLVLATGTVFALRQNGPLAGLFGKQQASVSLVVMPFDVSGQQDLAYLSSGLAGALSNGLAQLDGLRIIATSSARAVSEDDLTANQVGEKLNATHLVEGEIVPAGDRLRIAVRLVDASTGAQLWAQSYDGVGRELGALEFAIGKDLSAALQARLGVGEGLVADRSGVDPRAYEAYLKGIERISTRYDDSARKEAVRQLQLATVIDPDFADAHAGLAYILSLSVPPQLGMTRQEIIDGVKASTERALELDPGNALALTAKANADVNFTGDTESGIALAQRVLAQHPDYGPAHYVLASHLLLAGRAREALPHVDRAIESDPYNLIQRIARMIALSSLGDYEGVRKAALECTSDCFRFADVWLRTLANVGTPAEFERDFPLIEKRISGEVPADQLREIRAVLSALIAGRPVTMKPGGDADWGYHIAAYFARAGQVDHAFAVLRQTAAKSQADEAVVMLTDGRNAFPPELRADPRYHAVFRDFPQLARIATVRRANGVLGGLPIASSEIDAEKRRLAQSAI